MESTRSTDIGTREIASSTACAAAFRAFVIPGNFVSGVPYGNGHINDTYAVVCGNTGQPTRYILQRINERVFQDIPSLMENIVRVTEHAALCLASQPPELSYGRLNLSVVRTHDDSSYHVDSAGHHWRCYNFIENAKSHDIVQQPGQAREAAAAFGIFQRLLSDLPAPRLHETIADFHNTRRRFETLRRAVTEDRGKRVAVAREEIAFAMAHEHLVDLLLTLHARGEIPERITHNDTKLNNVLLHDVTGRGVCVIDLDTVMPGLALYDFGDMVRSATNSAPEDEKDLRKVEMRLPVFAALLDGYLSSVRGLLNATEIGHLVFSARLITFEIGMRFLTDFLDGDVYFKTRHASQNLHRCRCQFALLRSMEAQADEMNRLVDRLAK